MEFIFSSSLLKLYTSRTYLTRSFFFCITVRIFGRRHPEVFLKLEVLEHFSKSAVERFIFNKVPGCRSATPSQAFFTDFTKILSYQFIIFKFQEQLFLSHTSQSQQLLLNFILTIKYSPKDFALTLIYLRKQPSGGVLQK